MNDGSLAEVHRRRAGDAGEPGPPGHPGREAGLPVVLADRAPFPAGGRGDEPEPAVHADGDRRADQEDPARPVRQHRRLASSGAHRRADRAARRDQRRTRRVRHRPRLSAARERDAGPPLRLDDPGPGAQPQGVRGGGRDHQKCWTEPSFSHHGENFSIPPILHEVEPQADDRLFPDGQGRAPAGGRDRDRRARHVFGRQSGAGDDDDAEGAAGLPAAGAEAAPADLGAADQPALDQVGGRAWHQRRVHRRAERPAEEEHRDVLRGGGEGGWPDMLESRQVQVRLGRRRSVAAS